MINLDNNATTPLHPDVAEEMLAVYRRGVGNPASQHRLGQLARHLLQEARDGIFQLLGCRDAATRSSADKLIWTSGATEANNLALRGLTAPRGRILLSAVEHPSCHETALALRQQGCEVRMIAVDRHGVLQLEQLRAELTPETQLVSVMLANHETGAIQPLRAIVELCDQVGVPVHSDAAQAVGKIPVNFRQLGLAAMTVSAHKFHGPPGIGLLVTRGDMQLRPQQFGGTQQGGLRPGTEPVALARGMWRALQLWEAEAAQHERRMRQLRDRLESGLLAAEPAVSIHSHDAARLPQTSCLSLPGVDRQALLIALDLDGIACSTGSACESGSSEPSPVLQAMGLAPPLVDSALRLSLSRLTRSTEVDEAVHSIIRAYKKLRRLHESRKRRGAARKRLPNAI